MSFIQVQEVHLNSRTGGGSIIVNSNSGVNARTSQELAICCGRAFLSLERLQEHQRDEISCQYSTTQQRQQYSSIQEEQDPLGDLSFLSNNISIPPQQQQEDKGNGFINDNDDDDDRRSIRVEDIDDVDVFDEEPRVAGSDHDGDDDDNMQDWQDIEEEIEEEEEEEQEQGDYNNYEDEYDDDDEEEQQNYANQEWDEDEIEDVEVFEGSVVVRGERTSYNESKSGIRLISSLFSQQPGYSGAAGGSNNVVMQENITNSSREESGGRFKCDFPSCVYSTINVKTLRIHSNNAHDPTNAFPCSSCICRYKTKTELNRHMQIFHGQYGESPGLPEIAKVIVNGFKRFKCTACGYITRSEHPLQIHLHSAHDRNGKFRCPQCVCQYAKKNQLTQHIATHHNTKHVAPTETFVRVKSSSTAPAQLAVAPAKSKKVIKTRIATAGIAQVKLFTETGDFIIVNSKLVDNRTQYGCQQCSYSISKKHSIIMHYQNAHIKNGRYPCSYCCCRYDSGLAFHSHMKRQHGIITKKSRNANVPVNSGNRTTGNNNNVNNIVISPYSSIGANDNNVDTPDPTATTSTTVAPPAPADSYRLVFSNNKLLFKCEACGFMARDLNNTNTHIFNSHGPTAKYFCTHCTHRFSYRPALGIHSARCHPEHVPPSEPTDEPRMELLTVEGGKLFRCKLCSYVSANENKSRAHIVNSHWPDGQFQCEHCSCRFLLPGPLSAHRYYFHRELVDTTNNGSFVETTPTPTQNQQPRVSSSPAVARRPSMVLPTKPKRRAARYKTALINGKKLFYCTSCTLTSTKIKAIKHHVNAAHNPSNPFKCSKCTCRYALKGRLTAHISLVHGNQQEPSMPILSPKPPILERETDDEDEGKGYSYFTVKGVPTFKCDKCNYSTSEKVLMESHKDFHSLKNTYPCTLCTYRFPTNTVLLQHLTIDHDYAGSTFTNDNIEIMSRMSPPPVLSSELKSICSGYTRSVEDGGRSNIYTCSYPECTFVVNSNSKIRHHVGTDHDPNKKYVCNYCPFRLISQGRLDKHIKEVHGHDGDVGNETSTSGTVPGPSLENRNSIQKITPPPLFVGIAVLKCQISGCGFETQPQYEEILVNHMKIAHSPNANYKCSQCPCRYVTQSSLTQHIKSTHVSSKWKKPDESARKEVEESGINQDDQEEEEEFDDVDEGTDLMGHSGAQFKCIHCDFLATTKNGYVKHLTASHSAKNIYQCSQCVCRFATPGGLATHEYKSHKMLLKPTLTFKRGRPFKIKTTGTGLLERIMKSKKNLLAKKKTNVFACTLCTFTCKTTSSLEFHKTRAHPTGKANLHCEFCGNNYETRRGLHIHQKRIHKKIGTQNLDQEQVQSSQEPSGNLSRSAIAKAARKYAEVEFSSDLQSDDDELEKDETLLDKSGAGKVIAPPSTSSAAAPVVVKSPTKSKATLQCSKCPYVADAWSVTSHERRAHVENGFQCSLCTCTFRLESSLRKHVTYTHINKGTNASASQPNHVKDKNPPTVVSGENGHENEIEIESSSNIEENQATPLITEAAVVPTIKMTLHHCPECPFTCRLPISLETHQKTDHVKGTKYVCKFCPCSFRKFSSLQTHLKLFHNKNIAVQQGTGTPTKNSSSTSTSTSRVKLEPKEYQQNQNDEQITEGVNGGDIESADSPLLQMDKFLCPECPFTTSLRFKLRQHEKKHQGTSNFNDNTSEPLDSSESDNKMDQKEEEINHGKRKSLEIEQSEQSDSDIVDNAGVTSLEPSSKRAKIQNITTPTLKKKKMGPPPVTVSMRTSTRKSAEAARKVIESVIHSEQEDDEEYYKRNSFDNKQQHHEPKSKKAKIERKSSSASTSCEEVSFEDINNTSITKDSTPETKDDAPVVMPVTLNRPKSRHSSEVEEVATLTRANDRVASIARQSQTTDEPSTRTSGLSEFKKFTCSRCATNFATVMRLTTHYQTCEAELGNFNCNLCDNIYSSLLRLKDHIWNTHMLDEEKRKCETILGNDDPAGLAYSCGLCKRGLKDKKSYITHMAVPHLFRCRKCPFVCGTKTLMDSHKFIMHKNKKDSEIGKSAEDVSILFDSVKNKMTQQEEEKKEKSQENKDINVNVDVDRKENGDGDKDVEKKPEPESSESLICSECAYFSANSSEAREHSQAIMNVGSLICFICAYMGTSPCDSVLHSKTHNTEEKEDVIKTEDQNNTTVVPEFSVEIEFKDSPSPGQEAVDCVEIPMVSNDQLDSNQKLVLFDIPKDGFLQISGTTK